MNLTKKICRVLNNLLTYGNKLKNHMDIFNILTLRLVLVKKSLIRKTSYS